MPESEHSDPDSVPSRDEIAQLIAHLRGGDEEGRRNAIHRLVEIGHDAVPALLEDMASSPLNGWLRDRYLFVLKDQSELLAIEELHPVHAALQSRNYRLEVPLAASQALNRLRRPHGTSA